MILPSHQKDAKVVFLGDPTAGKPLIIANSVPEGHVPFKRSIKVDDVNVHLNIWDFGGPERFRAMAPMYFQNAVVAVFVFSLTDEDSFNHLKDYYSKMQECVDEEPALFLVGNNTEPDKKPVISREKYEQMAKEMNAIYCEVWPKTGEGIDNLFKKVAIEANKREK